MKIKDKSTIISTSYFPPIQYFKWLNYYDNIQVEYEEHYKKHSSRNRTSILGANGVLLLTVPIQNKHSSKTKIKNIKIANVLWKKNHINSIKAAYGSAPFFIYYFAEIEKILNKNYIFLIDLNNNILEYFMNELGVKKEIHKTDIYHKTYNRIIDFRNNAPINNEFITYRQVFGEKFIPNLSIIDLLFNLGPNANKYLTSR